MMIVTRAAANRRRRVTFHFDPSLHLPGAECPRAGRTATKIPYHYHSILKLGFVSAMPIAIAHFGGTNEWAIVSF